MASNKRAQQPLPTQLIPLNRRELRFPSQWRALALLADQWAEAEYRWPGSITTRKAKKLYQDALRGVELNHMAFWSNFSSREAAEEKIELRRIEDTWFERNHIISSGG